MNHHETVDEADQRSDEQHHEDAGGAWPLEAEPEFGGGHDDHRPDRRREPVDRL